MLSPTENKGTATTGQKMFLSTLSLFIMFYLVFVYQTVWNWFIADYLFTITYWQMFFGGAIIRFIINPLPVYNQIKKRDKKIKSLPFSVRLDNMLFSLFFTTASFVMFFIVRLIVSYYS